MTKKASVLSRAYLSLWNPASLAAHKAMIASRNGTKQSFLELLVGRPSYRATPHRLFRCFFAISLLITAIFLQFGLPKVIEREELDFEFFPTILYTIAYSFGAATPAFKAGTFRLGPTEANFSCRKFMRSAHGTGSANS